MAEVVRLRTNHGECMR